MPQRHGLTVVIFFLLCLGISSSYGADDAASALPDPERAQISHPPYYLSAEQLTLDAATRDVTAEGAAEIVSPEGTFTANVIKYNFNTRAGFLDDVKGTIAPFHIKAVNMSIDTNGLKHIQQASLTTCSNEKPHFCLLAHDLVVQPDMKYEARKVSFAINGQKLFTVPRLRGDLSGKDPVMDQPAISVGVSKLDGAYVAGKYTYPLSPSSEVKVQARLGSEGLLRGQAALEHKFTINKSIGGLVSLIGSHRADVPNRTILASGIDDFDIDDLTLNRMPVLAAQLNPIPLPGSLRHFAVQVGGSVGRYEEIPTDVTENRGQLWGILRTPTASVGSMQLYGELGLEQTFYPGEQYRTQAAMLTLATAPTRDRYLAVSFLHQRAHGNTPFLFDRVLSPDELSTEVEIPIKKDSPWRLGLWNRLDLNDMKMRDIDIAAIYKMDCLSYSVSYNAATQGFGVGMVLNAFGNFHRGAGHIAFPQ